MPIIRHIAGPYEDQVQYCVVCGKIITDYRGARWPDGQRPPQGFREGEVFVQGNMTSPVSPAVVLELSAVPIK